MKKYGSVGGICGKSHPTWGLNTCTTQLLQNNFRVIDDVKVVHIIHC